MVPDERAFSVSPLARVAAVAWSVVGAAELAYRWRDSARDETIPFVARLVDEVADEWTPVRAWVLAHELATVALVATGIAALLLVYRTGLILWRNHVIARVAGTYFRAEEQRFPARSVDVLREIRWRPAGHTFVGLTPRRTAL